MIWQDTPDCERGSDSPEWNNLRKWRKLDIKGDYRIPQQEEDKESEMECCFCSAFNEKKSGDRICVSGDFITWSAISHNDLLQEGVIEVKGKYRTDQIS